MFKILKETNNISRDNFEAVSNEIKQLEGFDKDIANSVAYRLFGNSKREKDDSIA